MNVVRMGIKNNNCNYEFRETCFGICQKNNQIYLTKKNNEFSLIGGGIEQNESYESCLKREFIEESGCTLKIMKRFCDIDCFWITRNNKNMESLTHIFLVEVEEKVKSPVETGSELVILDIDDVIEKLELPYQKKAFEIYLNWRGRLKHIPKMLVNAKNAL